MMIPDKIRRALANCAKLDEERPRSNRRVEKDRCPLCRGSGTVHYPFFDGRQVLRSASLICDHRECNADDGRRETVQTFRELTAAIQHRSMSARDRAEVQAQLDRLLPRMSSRPEPGPRLSDSMMFRASHWARWVRRTADALGVPMVVTVDELVDALEDARWRPYPTVEDVERLVFAVGQGPDWGAEE